MTTRELEAELKLLDPRVEIRSNPNRPGLANVFIGDGEVCPCPDGEVRDETDPDYVYAFPNGMVARHKSRAEVTARVKDVLAKIQDPEMASIFFDKSDE